MLGNKIFMIQMKQHGVVTEERKFPNVRELVGNSSRIYMLTLRWGAKQLMPNLAGLDKIIEGHQDVKLGTDAIDTHPHIRKLYSVATSDQKRAFLWMSHHLAPDKLDRMDKLIELNTRRATHSKHASHPGL